MSTIFSFCLVSFGCVYFRVFFTQDGTNMAQSLTLYRDQIVTIPSEGLADRKTAS
jgi:hypothetical protein